MRFLRTMPAILLSLTAYEISANRLFVVSDVKVDVTAENGLKAREKALAEGPHKAFLALKAKVKELNPGAHIASTNDKAIQSYVRGFTVQEERTLQTRYIATLQYEFKPSIQGLFGGVDLSSLNDQTIHATAETTKDEPLSSPEATNTLKEASKTSSEEIALNPTNSILLIPVYRVKDRTYLWQDENLVKQALLQTDHKFKGAKITVPYGDGDDIAQASLSQIIQGDETALKALGSRYQAQNNIWVMIVTADTDPTDQIKGYDITIRYLNSENKQPFSFHATSAHSKPIDSLIQMLFNKLNENENKLANQDLVQVTAHVSDLGTWVNIRKKINTIPGMIMKNITLKPGLARFKLHFSGSQEELLQTLSSSGIKVSNQGNGLVITGGQPNMDYSAPSPQYSSSNAMNRTVY
jgi:hypothetical protein